MKKKKVEKKVPLAAVKRTLKAFHLDYEEDTMTNNKGSVFRLLDRGYDTIIVNVYDTGTVTVQGGQNPGQARRAKMLQTALNFFMERLAIKDSLFAC